MPERFRSLPTHKLLRIIQRHATFVRQKGSHMTFTSDRTGKNFTFAKRNRDYDGSLVRKILTKDLALSPEEARNEVTS